MYNQFHEECGVFGIRTPKTNDIGGYVYHGLFALQHRGQEAAGIAVNEERIIRYHKGLGLVNEVFGENEMQALGKGTIAVGHVRYSTSGGNNVMNAQPMVVKHVKGQLALCHNGNLTNSYELRRKLELSGCIFQTSSDTEVISYLIIGNRLVTASIEEAVEKTMDELEGAYSLVMMSPAKLLAVRDPHGLRPLCYGLKGDGSIVFASESCALDAVGAELVRELEPGEIMIVDENGLRSIRSHCGKKKPSLCVFEYIYFARPDSRIDGLSVHTARYESGKRLAMEYPCDADAVIGVPDSGLDAALGFAKESGIPYGIGLVKNKYIGRSFIAPTQESRNELVDLKLNTIEEALYGKRIVLIDDSIVRGTTSARIVKLIRKAGAKEVHMRISAPPFLHPCYYGTDIDSKNSLIANGHSVEDIAKLIDVDSLGFLSVSALKEIAGENTCCACFNGAYPTPVPQHAQKERFEVSEE